MNQITRLTLRVCAGILAFVFALGLISSLSFPLSFILILFILPGLIIIFLAVIVILTIRSARAPLLTNGIRRRLIAVGSVPVIGILTMALALPALWAGDRAGNLSQLAVNYTQYEVIIAQAKQSGGDSKREKHSIAHYIDLGPPVRVAFNRQGFLDNWSGIIYDPTGIVMQADGFDPVSGDFAASDKITKLFGGDLVNCRHLWGNYYDCSFT
jgi:hypothetical protein